MPIASTGIFNNLAIDDNGYVYVLHTESSSGYLYKYDINGNLIWSVSFTQGYGVDVDKDGYVYAGKISTIYKYDKDGNQVSYFSTGTTSQGRGVTVDYNGYIYAFKPHESTGRVKKFTTDGTTMWELSLNDVRGIAIDEESNVYIAHGIRIRKVDSNGNLLWSNHPSGNLNDGPYDVAVDKNYVYVVGQNVFAKYDRVGNLIWSLAAIYAWTICIDIDGYIYVAGYNFISKYDGDGNIIWTISDYGAKTAGYGHSIASHPLIGAFPYMW